MARRKTPGLYRRGQIWWIDKKVRGYGRLAESCGTRDLTEAEYYLARRLEEIRQSQVYGVRPTRTLGQAAAKYLEENQQKRSIDRDAYAIKAVFKHVDTNIPLHRVHTGTFSAYKQARMLAGSAAGTVIKDLGTIRRILNLAARVWRHENGLTWLETAPLLEMVDGPARKPYPLTWEEQERLSKELPDYLEQMALFMVNTGLRGQEVCKLQWDWEVQLPELDTTVFVLPGDRHGGKNGEERLLVLNRIARRVLEKQRSKHSVWVFPYKDKPLHRMMTTAWKSARKRAGLRQVRVHDLKHTFGHRLRSAGVSLEDRKALLGHKLGDITSHYSAPDIGRLLEAANTVCDGRRLTVLRAKSPTILPQSGSTKGSDRPVSV